MIFKKVIDRFEAKYAERPTKKCLNQSFIFVADPDLDLDPGSILSLFQQYTLGRFSIFFGFDGCAFRVAFISSEMF